MKCFVCRSEFAGWRTTCPKCQIPVLSIHKETVSELGDGVQELGRRGSALFSVLRVGALAVVLTILATAVRLNYASSGKTQELSGRANIRSVATPSPGPGPSADQPVGCQANKPAERTALKTGSDLSDQVGTVVPGGGTRRAENSTSQAEISDNRTLRPVPSAPLGKESQGERIAGPVMAEPSKNSVPSSAPAAVEPAVEAAPEISLEPPDKTLSNHTGLLTMNSYIKARIYIDGQYSGTTPRTVKLLSGEHKVTLIADGFEEWTRKIRLNGRQQTGLMASMSKKG